MTAVAWGMAQDASADTPLFTMVLKDGWTPSPGLRDEVVRSSMAHLALVLSDAWTSLPELADEIVRCAWEAAAELQSIDLMISPGHWINELWSRNEIDLTGRFGGVTAQVTLLDWPSTERRLKCSRIDIYSARLFHATSNSWIYDLRIRKMQNSVETVAVAPKGAEQAIALPVTDASPHGDRTRGFRRPPKRYIEQDDAIVRKFLADRGIPLPLSDKQVGGLWNRWCVDIAPDLPGDGELLTKRARARRAFRRVTGR